MRNVLSLLSIVLWLCAAGFQPVNALAADVPWPEHPRPDFQRSPWVNLNGEWQFTFDPDDVGEQQGWFTPGKHTFDRRIIVPFPWESRLSGIGDTEYKGVAWYSREITLPEGDDWKGKDAWLVIGACDWEAKVWVNGELATEHVGGYLPFDVNLSQFARPGERVTIAIRAKDITDPQQPTGKQIGWYTRTSGIWQTVYLEPRGRSYIEGIECHPRIDGTAAYTVHLDRPQGVRVRVRSPQNAFPPTEIMTNPTASTAALKVKVAAPRLWSPDQPTLYSAIVEILAGDELHDSIETYFGLREISTANAPGRDYQYVYLNGKPIYLKGLLHQSFHPEGIHQYPDDATMRSDYELCKRTGINFVRIHIKTPIPRELYWADRLGVMVMQDLPNFWHHSQQARKWYEQMLEGAIARDFNHPSIFTWVNFNETWGLDNPGPYDADRQEWVETIYHRTKRLDPTRLVIDNSPNKYDHVITDINAWHFYFNDYATVKRHIQAVVDHTHPGSTFNYIGGRTQGTEPLMNTEHAGISAGHGDQDISWSLKYQINELRLHDKVCGYIYTELSDIEWEHNGFVNYDRSPKEFGYEFWHPGFTLTDINNPDFIVIDAPPLLRLAPGTRQDVPIRLSHWSGRPADALSLRWRTSWLDRFGEKHVGEWQVRPAEWQSYTVTDAPPITLSPAADQPGILGALNVELTDGPRVIARNYINLLVEQPPPPRVEVLDPLRVALRFDPVDVADWQWGEQPPPIVSGIAAEKVWAFGAGHLEYRLQLPDDLNLDDLSGIEFLAELASKADDERLDWPQRRRSVDYPQTDVTKWPSDIVITLNGLGSADASDRQSRERIPAEQVRERILAPAATAPAVPLLAGTLPDDPADARGVLSHLHQYHPGSYGTLVRASLELGGRPRQLADLRATRRLAIRLEVPEDAKHRGGLAVFGDGLGAYPVDPTVVLVFRSSHGLPSGHTSDDRVAVDGLAANQVVLVPTAETGEHTWRYNTERPAGTWIRPDFDDSGWPEGLAGFGTPQTPNSIVRTVWDTGDIWLRTEFTLDDAAGIRGGRWRFYYDEDMDIYLNGHKVIERRGYITQYADAALDPHALGLLRRGRNVLAVRCRQTVGGQNIDVGLSITGRQH